MQLVECPAQRQKVGPFSAIRFCGAPDLRRVTFPDVEGEVQRPMSVESVTFFYSWADIRQHVFFNGFFLFGKDHVGFLLACMASNRSPRLELMALLQSGP
jgi:hypothetical protein